MTAKENEQTRDASDDELGEFLGDLFKSHRQLMARRQRSDDEALQFLEETFCSFSSSHRQPKRRITDDEEPIAKRLAESTTVASSRERQRRWLRATKKRRPRRRRTARRCRKGPTRLLSCQACLCQLVFYGAFAPSMRVPLSRRWSSV